jgi:hypothetical protein
VAFRWPIVDHFFAKGKRVASTFSMNSVNNNEIRAASSRNLTRTTSTAISSTVGYWCLPIGPANVLHYMSRQPSTRGWSMAALIPKYGHVGGVFILRAGPANGLDNKMANMLLFVVALTIDGHTQFLHCWNME